MLQHVTRLFAFYTCERLCERHMLHTDQLTCLALAHLIIQPTVCHVLNCFCCCTAELIYIHLLLLTCVPPLSLFHRLGAILSVKGQSRASDANAAYKGDV